MMFRNAVFFRSFRICIATVVFSFLLCGCPLPDVELPKISNGWCVPAIKLDSGVKCDLPEVWDFCPDSFAQDSLYAPFGKGNFLQAAGDGTSVSYYQGASGDRYELVDCGGSVFGSVLCPQDSLCSLGGVTSSNYHIPGSCYVDQECSDGSIIQPAVLITAIKNPPTAPQYVCVWVTSQIPTPSVGHDAELTMYIAQPKSVKAGGATSFSQIPELQNVPNIAENLLVFGIRTQGIQTPTDLVPSSGTCFLLTESSRQSINDGSSSFSINFKPQCTPNSDESPCIVSSTTAIGDFSCPVRGQHSSAPALFSTCTATTYNSCPGNVCSASGIPRSGPGPLYLPFACPLNYSVNLYDWGHIYLPFDAPIYENSC